MMRIRLIFPEFQFLLSRIIAQTVFRFGGRYAIAFQFFLSCILTLLSNAEVAWVEDFQFFLKLHHGSEDYFEERDALVYLSILSELHLERNNRDTSRRRGWRLSILSELHPTLSKLIEMFPTFRAFNSF